MRKYAGPIGMFCLFEAIAVTLWLAKDNLFYLFNFTYIGGSLALGMLLYIRRWKYARHVVQFLVGGYMLVYLGVICRENMQIEGFWYYLFSGVFEAAVIHYAVAKIFGPLFFGRGWCGYACWTAMVLDLLPYKEPQQPGKKRLGWIRYALFAGSLLFVGALFVFDVVGKEQILWISFLAGNALYYAVGIALAFAFRDNRAFCKYICPSGTLFGGLPLLASNPTLRAAAGWLFSWKTLLLVAIVLLSIRYYRPFCKYLCPLGALYGLFNPVSLYRLRVDQSECVHCGKCQQVCGMDIPVWEKPNSIECIRCGSCKASCPTGAIHSSLEGLRVDPYKGLDLKEKKEHHI